MCSTPRCVMEPSGRASPTRWRTSSQSPGLLDDYGVGFIEGGWPGAMPKDTEFFARARGELDLRTAKLVAFGATRKRRCARWQTIRRSQHCWSRRRRSSRSWRSPMSATSTEALRTTTRREPRDGHRHRAYLVSRGGGCSWTWSTSSTAIDTIATTVFGSLEAALAAGADVGVLCDTNGGMLPSGIHRGRAAMCARTVGVRLGIHCQDDTGCAIANTISAVEAGVTHVQCTANGYGERTGNADLFPVVANLETKLDMRVLPDGKLRETMRISHAIAEIANIAPDTHQPYAGVSSFAHKAGLHASALKVNADLYNHIDPALVGNDQRVLITEMAGRASVELKGRELGYDLSDEPEVLTRVVDRVKDLEAQGWTFEAADASFEMLLLDEGSRSVARHFTVESWRTIVEQSPDGRVVSEATVKLHAGGERAIVTAEGNGPVNALDQALRKAVVGLFPELTGVSLTDYKVRLLNNSRGTDAITRVLIGTTDGDDTWSTIGVHENVIAASWRALEDAVSYALLRRRRD